MESLALLIISSVQASSSSTFSNVESHDTCPSQFYFHILIFNCFLVQSSIDQAIWEGGRELNDRLTGGVKPLDPLRAPPLAQAPSMGSLSSIAGLSVLLLGRVSPWIFFFNSRMVIKLSSKGHYGKLPPVL